MIKPLGSIFLASVILSCSSTPKATAPTINDMKNRLGMNRQPQDLGFKEEKFDRCDLGYDNPNGCKDEYLVVIHFRLLCRDSEGTVESTGNLNAVKSSSVNWKLGASSGITQTDDQGYGKVEAILPKSSATDRFRLTIEGKFLAIPEASEVASVVAPKDWCNK